MDRYYVGSSNIAGILGVSPYSTPLQEYQKIVGDAPAPTPDELAFFNRRKRLEPFIFETLEVEHGISLPVRNQRYRDPEHDFLRAEIDAENEDTNGEAKSVHPLAAKDWGPVELGDRGVPLYVLAQVQFGLMIRPKPKAVVVGQVGFDGCRPFPVHPDPELMQMLRARAVAFWREHVLPRVPPDPINVEDVRRLYERSRPVSVVADEGLAAQMRELAVVKARLKADAESEDRLATAAKLALGEADTLVGPDGKVLATWRTNKQSAPAFNEARFRLEHPALWQSYVEPTRPNRPFLLKIKHGGAA